MRPMFLLSKASVGSGYRRHGRASRLSTLPTCGQQRDWYLVAQKCNLYREAGLPPPPATQGKRGTDRGQDYSETPQKKELFTDVDKAVQLSGIIARRGAFGVVR